MKKVIVGLSGGVDSAVCAYLLKKKGYELIGINMVMSDASENSTEDAESVANALCIPFYTVDLRDNFNKTIIDYFIRSYLNGSTPNPCVICNRLVKWETLVNMADKFGAEHIATGHYANVVEKNSRYTVKTSKTDKKDQTYALYNLTQNQLAKTIMPLGCYTKEETRKIAGDMHLPVANKPDSQEICFIPDNDYVKFIRQHIKKEIKPGNFIDCNHNILGRHEGIISYTIGQRKGLNIAFGKPMYVTEILPDTNEVILGDNNDLWRTDLTIENINFMSVDKVAGEMRAFGKIRYAHKKSPCTIKMDNNRLKAVFDEPQRAVTRGQAAVFYDDDDCIICGGTII